MFVKNVKYVNFDGDEVSKDLYFHLYQHELIRLETSYPDGLEAEVKKITNSKNNSGLIELFEKLIQMAYGIREGEHFRKTPQILQDLTDSPAYEALFLLLLQDEQQAISFFNGLVPDANKPAKK